MDSGVPHSVLLSTLSCHHLAQTDMLIHIFRVSAEDYAIPIGTYPPKYIAQGEQLLGTLSALEYSAGRRIGRKTGKAAGDKQYQSVR